MIKKIIPALFLFFSTSLLSPLSAQMFSVENSERVQYTPLTPYMVTGISWEIADFTYTGETLSEEERADFSNSILRLRLENPGLHVSVAFGGRLTGMDETSYFNLNAMLFNDIPFMRSARYQVSIPFKIVTDLKGARRNNAQAEFQQSSFIFGTGLASRFKLTDRVDMSARGGPLYGFSFAQGNFFGGSLFRTMAQVRLHFADVIGNNALTFGYDFDYRNYDIEGDENDYKFSSHTFTIGVGF